MSKPKGISPHIVRAAYYRYGTIKLVARHLNISVGTVTYHLKTSDVTHKIVKNTTLTLIHGDPLLEALKREHPEREKKEKKSNAR